MLHTVTNLNLIRVCGTFLMKQNNWDKKMQSSTIRRSNLSKEKMAVLETLSKYRADSFDDSPSVYVRPVDKEKELDMLWQNFKISQKREKSPNVYLVTGFVAGIAVMLVLGIIISFSLKGINTVKENSVLPAKKENLSLNFIPSTSDAQVNTEVYEVKDGDTMESVLIRFYGSYSKEKEAKVLAANNLTNPDKLSIGQILTIPVGE